MKKQIALLIFFLLALTLNAVSQIKEITKKEYQSVQNVAEPNFEKFSYRQLTKIEKFDKGKAVSVETIIEESLPPNKNSWTSIEKSGDKVEKIEIINIGYVQYRRENNGKWAKEGDENEDESADNNPRISISGRELANRKKYTVEGTKLNNQSVRVYSVITIYDYEPDISHTFRRWINSGNLILQTEEIENEISSGNVKSRSVAKYDYNPKNIKIVAPVK